MCWSQAGSDGGYQGDDSIDPRTKAARGILEECGNGAVAVSKPVRGGFTTSSVYAAEAMGKRLLCIAPTKRILQETVGAASGGEAVRVPGNVECPLLAEEIREFPILKDLPLSLPDCSKCPGYDGCDVTKILRRPDFETAALTYAKVQALMLSGSKTSKKIRQILEKADYVLLDEAHTLGFGSVPSAPVGPLPAVPEVFKRLEKVRGLWLDLLNLHGETITELQDKATNGAASHHLSKPAYIPEPLSWRAISGAWSELRALAKTGEIERSELLRLRDAIEILSYPWGSLHYVTEDEGRAGSVVISGSHAKGERAISEFLHNVVPFAGHVYVSGTLIEPHDDYFAELSGKPVHPVVFPDIKRASERLTLIPDCWSLNAGGFSRKLPAIIDQIRQIAEREKEPLYCLCPNVAKAAVIRAELKKAGVSGVLVDYYRSDMSIGVARSERVAVCIGMAELPANACDPLARGKDEDERWLDSRRLRIQAVHAATWQSLNRVRDPNGEVPSRVYMVGVRVDDLRELARWGPNRRAVPGEIRDGKTPDGQQWRTVKFTIEINKEIEHCNIFCEEWKANHSEKRNLSEIIGEIELYNNHEIKRQNHSFLPTIYNREKGVILAFYKSDYYKNNNAGLLRKLFFAREDTFAEQFKSYARVTRPLENQDLLDHLDGKRTIGAYHIAPDDTVKWGCFDIDTHNEGESGEDARAKVQAIVKVLRSHGVPFLLEASGSPDSYHIWIFLKKTRTYNAYRFMRQVRSQAKVAGIEVFPKQKRMKSDRFGNLVKLPLGVNKKNGARSVFLDPDSFDPLEGDVPVTGRVSLLEVPELSGDVKGMPKARIEKPKPNWSTFSSTSLDYCMVQMLASGVSLVGGEGHLARVAIATKAADIGMPPVEAAMLFKDQLDFNFNISLEKATEIADRGYFPWSCEKLRDSCGEFVAAWCPSCPCCRRNDYSAETASRKNDTTEPFCTYLVKADVPSFEFGGRSWNLRRGDLVGGLPGFVVDLFLNEGALVEVGV